MTPTATSLTTSTPLTTTSATKAESAMSSDFETFLKMLTTQARYQDPLEPIDSSEYSAQLAQFSMVEQQVLSNDLLKALSAQLGSDGIGQVAGWIGMEARSSAPAQFNGSPITVAPVPAASAEKAELIVYNAQGNEVQRSPISVLEQQIQWAGVSNDGTPFPSGKYSFAVESTSGNEVLATTPAETYSRIVEARIESTGPRLLLSGGESISTTDVKALREAP